MTEQMQIGDKQLQRTLGTYATVGLVCQLDMEQLQKLQAKRQAVDQVSINPAISMVLYARFHVLPYAQPDGVFSYHFCLFRRIWLSMQPPCPDTWLVMSASCNPGWQTQCLSIRQAKQER